MSRGSILDSGTRSPILNRISPYFCAPVTDRRFEDGDRSLDCASGECPAPRWPDGIWPPHILRLLSQ